MHRTIVRSIAAATAAFVALTVGPPAGASDIAHTNVASETPATFTPHLFANGFKPYALTINQAGDQMVVGGRFNAVENSTRTQTYTRSNVFAFNRFTGAVNQAFDPVLNGQVWSVAGQRRRRLHRRRVHDRQRGDPQPGGQAERVDRRGRPGLQRDRRRSRAAGPPTSS